MPPNVDYGQTRGPSTPDTDTNADCPTCIAPFLSVLSLFPKFEKHNQHCILVVTTSNIATLVLEIRGTLLPSTSSFSSAPLVQGSYWKFRQASSLSPFRLLGKVASLEAGSQLFLSSLEIQKSERDQPAVYTHGSFGSLSKQQLESCEGSFGSLSRPEHLVAAHLPLINCKCCACMLR